MKKSWTVGLEPDQKKLMEQYFKESPLLRERLVHLLENKVRVRETDSTSLACYESPSWAHVQADANGYKRALMEVVELISN